MNLTIFAAQSSPRASLIFCGRLSISVRILRILQKYMFYSDGRIADIADY